MQVIEAENLTRNFGGRCAVDRVSFAVQEGEVFGFLGPNGAGKTTTIRLLTGQLVPTAGRARVLGYDAFAEQDKVKPLVGVVFEYQNLYERLSGRANLLFSAQLYAVRASRVDELLARVGLRERAGDTVQRYSNGMKQRLLIARALLHAPRVLFLDEPTRGLDPGVAREIRKLVAELALSGVTVFLTTHYMEEADQLCRRVAFLHEGRVVALDTPERLKVAHGNRVVHLVLDDGRSLSIPLDDQQRRAELQALVGAGRIQTMHSGEATLEEVFLQLTGRRLIG